MAGVDDDGGSCAIIDSGVYDRECWLNVPAAPKTPSQANYVLQYKNQQWQSASQPAIIGNILNPALLKRNSGTNTPKVADIHHALDTPQIRQK